MEGFDERRREVEAIDERGQQSTSTSTTPSALPPLLSALRSHVPLCARRAAALLRPLEEERAETRRIVRYLSTNYAADATNRRVLDILRGVDAEDIDEADDADGPFDPRRRAATVTFAHPAHSAGKGRKRQRAGQSQRV